MGVRESLNENKRLGLGVATGVVVVGLAIISFQVFGGSKGGGIDQPTQVFYTDDNGKTFFKDDVYKVSPFDRSGKKAYRAEVFQCDDGKQFVGLIYRHNALGRKAMEEYLAKGADDRLGTFLAGLDIQGLEAKAPGAPDTAWKANYGEKFAKCPSGGPARLVTP
jgi:hypothetical protein